ncbi:AAA family ATPase [Dactylosporangium sp. CA-092794]|uniref:AAA family ATPase n=1 Tax=Dactylosporangium sp. CA-092794 TaxID=3239929 RepID=UPI003D8FC746
MAVAASPPPLAWYGSSFAYYDDPPAPTDEELDAAAERAREERLAGFAPEQFGPQPGGDEGSGVVLGRFLPVHDGHRYLIEFARAHVADLHVFVRVEPGDPVPWAVRRDWLAELYPGVTLTAVQDGPDASERWVAAILDRVRPDFLFAGEAYGAGLARRLGARFVAVDRSAIPVSGTQVRDDPWAFERYLPPPVRAWYARRVCIVGAESTGKTTLAARLAEHYRTVWVPERLRAIGSGAGAVSPADISLAAHGQRVAEDVLARRASRVLICDTGVLSVRMWSERLFGTAPGWLREAAGEATADLYLLTAPDIPFAGDDGRNTPAERREFHAAWERELARLGRPYTLIDGPSQQRFTRAVEVVDALLQERPVR